MKQGIPEPVTTRSPWTFVPLLYFLEGLPYVIVTGVSVLLFKALALEFPNLGLENDSIAFWTTLIGLPWTLKMLWGPMVDLTLTKRRWIVLTQGLLLLGFLVLAWTVQLPSFFMTSLVVLFVLAFLSATHDIAADGFYLLSMGKQDQAFFVGVRSTFYRLAMIFSSGLLVVLAGQFEKITNQPYVLEKVEGSEVEQQVPLNALQRSLQSIDQAFAPVVGNDIVRAWVLALLFGAGVFAICWLLNALLMPKPALDRTGVVHAADVAVSPIQPEPEPEPVVTEQKLTFLEALGEFLNRAKIGWILMFILFYRFGESMISKISPLFLKDPVEKGGLGLKTDAIGVITGTYGVIALLIGGILGGILIATVGFRRAVWPMVFALNLPNLFYIWAAINRPGEETVRWLIVTDQFGYGFGFSAYMVYLMIVARGTRFPTSSYAVATGLMALGATLEGTLSGILQVQLGYTRFFILVVLLGLPGVVTLFFIPKEEDDMSPAMTGEEDVDALLNSRNKWLPLTVLGVAVTTLLALSLWPVFAPRAYTLEARKAKILAERHSPVRDSVSGQTQACGDATRQVIVHMLESGEVVVDVVEHREGSGKNLQELEGKAKLVHSQVAELPNDIPRFDDLCFKGNMQ